MANLPSDNLHFHQSSIDGPWGVGSTSNAWYVVNKFTGRAKRIGCVGGKKINYFDRALEEAHRRNTKEGWYK